MDEADLDTFTSQVAGAYKRMTDIEQRARQLTMDDDVLLLETVEELRTALEELQVANEELRTQTEELESARALLEGERLRYRDLFASAPDAYLVTDTVGVIQEANLKAGELLGVRTPFLRGQPLALYVAEDRRRAFRTELVTLVRTRGVQDLPLRLQCLDGGKIEVAARVEHVPGAEPGHWELRWTLRNRSAERVAEETASRLRDLEAQLTRQHAHAEEPPKGPARVEHARALATSMASWWDKLDGAVVMIPDAGGRLRLIGAQDEDLRVFERLHAETGEGPALTAYRTGQPVHVQDLSADEGYPVFGPAAAKAGIHGVLVHPLLRGSRTIGVLVLRADEPGEITSEVLAGAGLLAEATVTLIANAQDAAASEELAAQLQTALDSRIMIEQAKGKLAERLGCRPDDAFRLLRRYARSHNLRLHDLAGQIVRDEASLDR